MTAPPPGGPPKEDAAPRREAAPTETPNQVQSSESCPLCTLRDQVCICGFYLDWTVWPSDPSESVGVQLRRRREASYRLPRTACGRRDPISASWW